MKKESTIEKRRQCAIDEFECILKTYILPLVQHEGSLILKSNPTKSSNLKKHIKHYKKGDTYFLYFFPALSTPQFHYRIRTQNPTQELGAAEQILREILKVSQFDYRSDEFTTIKYYDKNNLYRNNRFNIAFEVGLCSWLGSECIYELIDRLRDWSQKTYEGNHMSFGFIVDATQNSKGIVDYLSFLKSNHSAVFTDGMSSGIKLDNKGRIVKYFSAVQEQTEYDVKHTPWTPYEFIDFANKCYSDNGSNWIGVIMQSNGDMLIFKSKQLVFVKRNGKWAHLDSYTVHSTISSKYNKEQFDEFESKKFADEIYSSLLDTSFAHTGGCIAIISDEYVDIVKSQCFPKDSLDNDTDITEKKTIIKRLISTGSIEGEKQYFQYLDRKLRLELMSLDGATVLDSCGRILCVGAIVKIDGGSDGGGRTAAAKELAKFGLAMKISADGAIQCYANNGNKESIELFKIL